MGSQNEMDHEQGSRLVRSSTVVGSRWMPTQEHKRILGSIFASGTTRPSAHLQGYGRVEGKNVFYWFQNSNAREKRKREQSQSESFKRPGLFESSKWPCLFRSKKSSDKSSVKEEEEMTSAVRWNSSVDPSDLRTLELFPLRPDKGGI